MPDWIAYIYECLNENDEPFYWLDKAYEGLWFASIPSGHSDGAEFTSRQVHQLFPNVGLSQGWPRRGYHQ